MAARRLRRDENEAALGVGIFSRQLIHPGDHARMIAFVLSADSQEKHDEKIAELAARLQMLAAA